MDDSVVRIEHLAKRYRIGGKQAAYKTLRESLMGVLEAPRRWLARNSKTPGPRCCSP